MNSLADLIRRLTDAEIEFVIIGGFAGVLYGSSYVTQDLDVCAVLSSENLDRLRRALADLHPKHRMTPQKWSFLDRPAPGEAVANLYLETDWGVIDILSNVLGIGGYDRVASKAQSVELGGRKCRVISVDDLIKAKEAVGREKDLLAAKELKMIRLKRRNDDLT